MRLRLNNLAEVERWVLSWGGHATVERPDRLRESLLKIAGELQGRYAEATGQVTKPKKLPGL